MSEDTKPDQTDSRNQPPTPPAGVAGPAPAAGDAQPQVTGAEQPASGAAPQPAAQPQAPAQPQQPAAAPQQPAAQPQQPATGADGNGNGNGSRNPFQLPDDQMPFIPNPNYKGDKPAQMSGAMKALWIVLGMMIGIFSLLVAVISFLGSDVRTRSLRSQALKYSCIGVILGALLDMIVLGVMGVDLSSVTSLGTGATTGGSSSTGSAF